MLLTVYPKHSILDGWSGYENTCFQIAPNKHNKHQMGYFEFLNGLSIIGLPLNISEKLHWQYLFENVKGAETHRLHLC